MNSEAYLHAIRNQGGNLDIWGPERFFSVSGNANWTFALSFWLRPRAKPEAALCYRWPLWPQNLSQSVKSVAKSLLNGAKYRTLPTLNPR
jgi:hypothetical protein